MVGKVIFQPIKDHDISEGILTVLKSPRADSSNYLYEMVTVDHLDVRGNWVVKGEKYSGAIVPNQELGRFAVNNVMEGTFPLVLNQYKRVLKTDSVNQGHQFEFETVPLKFVKGSYMNRCVLCTAQFTGAKRQVVCKNCCHEHPSAKLKLDTETKVRRRRSVSLNTTKDIAKKAFRLGQDGASMNEFNSWLEKQFQ